MATDIFELLRAKNIVTCFFFFFIIYFFSLILFEGRINIVQVTTEPIVVWSVWSVCVKCMELNKICRNFKLLVGCKLNLT